MEALPWIKHAWGRTVVIKYGGAAMTDPALRDQVAADIVLMKLVGVNPVVVHGGGPEITCFMDRLGHARRVLRRPAGHHRRGDGSRQDGARRQGEQGARARHQRPRPASGRRLGRGRQPGAARRSATRGSGRVGEVTGIDTTVLDNLIEDGFIPVVATVAAGDDGGSFNVNADLVAGELAAALGADKVIFLTDVDGLYRDFSDKSSLISALTPDQAEEMIVDDALEGGMVPKVAACVHALRGGVRRAHILNGTVPHALLLEVYTDEGVGTMIADDLGGEVE